MGIAKCTSSGSYFSITLPCQSNACVTSVGYTISYHPMGQVNVTVDGKHVATLSGFSKTFREQNHKWTVLQWADFELIGNGDHELRVECIGRSPDVEDGTESRFGL